MAVVGDAYIVVRAITTGFEEEVRRAARGIDLNKDGRGVGDTFSRGFSQGLAGSLGRSLGDFQSRALAARDAFQQLVRTGYLLGPILAGTLSAIGALAAGLVSLASSLIAAAPSVVVFANAIASLGLAAVTTAAAFSGVSNAIQAGVKAQTKAKKSTDGILAAQRRLLKTTEDLTEAQKAFEDAVRDAREEVQQLDFSAEDAAISEKKAAIELEKARETLQRVQDLPPNSRARREAQIAFAEAELNLRKAKDKNADLRAEQDRLAESAAAAGTERFEQTKTYLQADKKVKDAVIAQKEAQEDLNKAQAGGSQFDNYNAALEGLSEAARSFVKYIVGTFIPSLKLIRDAAAEGLFPGLIKDLERLRTELFPSLTPVVNKLALDVSSAFSIITDAILQTGNLDDLLKLFELSGINIQSYARSLSNLYGSFLSILVSAQPLVERFNKFIENKTAYWDNFLNLQQASGDLTKFFNKAGDIAAKLGDLFGNVFGGISSIVKANFSPGGGGYVLINWLDDVTEKFDSFASSNSGQARLAEYFKATAENTKSALQAVGAFLKEILKAGASPGVKGFFDTIKLAAPSFGSLLTQLNSTGPVFANFLVSLIKFTEVTLTSGAIQNFFTVLTTALNALTSILSTPQGKAFFDLASKLLAIRLAFGTLGKAASFGGNVVAGSIISMGNALGVLTGKASLLGGIGARITATFAPMAAALGVGTAAAVGFVAAAAAVVAVLILAYNNSEKFRESVGSLFESLKNVISGAIGDIKLALEAVFGGAEGLQNAFKAIGDFIGTYLVPIIKFSLATSIGLISGAIQSVIFAVGALKSAFEVVVNFIRGILALLRGDFSEAADAFKNVFMSAITLVKRAFQTIAAPFQGVINALIDAYNLTLGNFKIKLPGILGGGEFGFPKLQRLNIAALAEGGVVQPGKGGTLAQIAEAGRPERVEPLDSDGLSKRDKALIKTLQGESSARGITLNVYPSEGMDERSLAAMVSRQLAFQLRRGGAY